MPKRTAWAKWDRQHDDLTSRLKTYARALREGAVWKAPQKIFWDISGRCTGSVIVDFDTRWVQDDTTMAFVPVGDRAIREVKLFMDIKVPCRKCDACLRARARLWRNRAATEIRRSARTWFGTFTLSPENHYVMLCRASLPVGHSPEDEFKARHAEVSKELTKYWKRVRKQSNSALRYILVAERHKNGLPHYHALIHEISPFLPVRHSTLSEQWQLGYTNFKLIETAQHAGYVTKYLSKDAVARVRASRRYGMDDL